METITTKPDKTVASLIHLSTFSKYFIPFGNFIIPLIFWTAKKSDPFVDAHSKQALNFQISLFLYYIFLVAIGIAGVIIMGIELSLWDPAHGAGNFEKLTTIVHALPLLFFIGVIGILILALFIMELVTVITATFKASEGQYYKYPLTINFITPTPVGIHQSKNEQFNNDQNQTL